MAEEQRARRKWPGLRVDAAHFRARLRSALQSSGSVHSEDLYFVCALQAQDRLALEHFERTLLPELKAVITRIHRTPVFFEEASQRLREILFLAEDARPSKLSQYTGRGRFLGWLKAVAVG